MRTPDVRTLYAGIIGLTAIVFFADLITPLGIVIWIFYLVPLGLTLAAREPALPPVVAFGITLLIVVTGLTDDPGVTPAVAYANRVFGIVVVWAMALLLRNLIVTRNRLETEEWVQSTHTRVLEAMQGELSLAQIGERALAVLSTALEAPVSALYALAGTELQLAAVQGASDVPEVLTLDRGLLGETARSGRPTVIRDVPESHLTVQSSFMRGKPRHLVLVPLQTDGTAQGVLELGFTQAPDERAMGLLRRSQDAIAVALRTAFFRDRLRALLQETQRQAEQLQAQQEELRVSNEELEQQSELLKASQARLEAQQAELEATNEQLESQAHDLEQQKYALSLAKQEAERASRYKSEFLANMSHELRTPLNSTLILAKLLAENKGGRLSEEQVRYAETIYASGNSLLTLINDILDLSKIEAGAIDVQAAPVAVSALVDMLQRTFEPIAAERSLEFTVDIAPGAPQTITTDTHRLQQILTNLLSNAFKFTETGGVALRVLAAGAQEIAFEVRDTGVGIAPEHQEMIFEAFRQADGSTHRRFGGTGLGLSISRELARVLGGDIAVSSAPGHGSTFTLRVRTGLQGSRATHAPFAAPGRSATATAPVPPAEPSYEARPAAPAPERRWPRASGVQDDRDRRRRPGRLILVVEDDLSFARILYDLAHELDFDCVLASTTEEGMTLARDLSPSGILLDLNLPDGSGLTLLDRLKRNPDTRHIPVHIVSVDDNSQTALALGAVGYAIKPAEREQMVNAIRKLEARLDQRVRRVLVVEDDAELRASIRQLLQLDDVVIHEAATAREALEQLAADSFDCVVLDLHLPDASGYEILETMSANEQYSFPPVIVYTGSPISPEEEETLRRYSRSVIVKGARSPERLLDEVTLFLHQVESRLPPEARRRLEAARERDEMFEGRKILVVEDDVRNVFALTSVFEPRGAKVIIARNGREGVEQAIAARPDLILMDIMMPEMDGLAATRELRRTPELRNTPIIALTAKAMRDDYEQCLAAGASDYLAKPLDVDKLVSLCRVWMSR